MALTKGRHPGASDRANPGPSKVIPVQTAVRRIGILQRLHDGHRRLVPRFPPARE